MKALLAALVVLLLASVALAQGPVNYPPEVGAMTDAQFQQWATAYNQQRVIEWQARKAKAQANQPQYLPGQTTESTAATAPAATAATAATPRIYGQGYGNGPGDYSYGSNSFTQRTVTFQAANPNYVSPGPLTLVNPYCPPRPSTAEEQAEIKRVYDAAVGKVLTVHSADGTPLHIKVIGD